MKSRAKLIPSMVLAMAMALIWIKPAAAAPDAFVKSVAVPGVTANWSFDISWVDGPTSKLFVADRDNKGISVFDSRNLFFLGTIKGFKGNLPTGTGGPNGVVYLPDKHEVWGGDGDSTVKVGNLSTMSVVATIPTGGTTRADEIAYDQDHHIILVANDTDAPPFLTFISSDTRQVVGHISLPQATAGVEQPQYDPGLKKFFQAIPATTAHPEGELMKIDPVTMQVEATYGLSNCGPNGLTIGPGETALLGCNHFNPNSQINVQIISLTTGQILKTITQTGAPDEVWFNPGDNRYYVGATGWTSNGLAGGPNTPVLGIIDALTGNFISNIPTGTTRAASVAVDPTNNFAFMPHRADGNRSAELRVYAPAGTTGASITASSQNGQDEILFKWDGTVGYAGTFGINRITPAGTTTLNVSTSNGFFDTFPAGQPWACYQAVAFDITGAAASHSDALCELNSSVSGTPPTNFSVSLNQSNTTTLKWTPVGNPTNTGFLPLGTNRLTILPGTATGGTDNTGGAITCYVAGEETGTTITGVTKTLCVVPGQSDNVAPPPGAGR